MTFILGKIFVSLFATFFVLTLPLCVVSDAFEDEHPKFNEWMARVFFCHLLLGALFLALHLLSAIWFSWLTP